MLLAIDISTWPGVNQAFLFSFALTLVLTFAAIPYGNRRPIGTPFTWGESMIAAVYATTVMFIAYGVVPDRWIQHADKNLEWTKQKLLFGPFDIIVVVIHLIFFALQIWIWIWWQNRGKKTASTELATSTYGRPLVKKA